MSNILFKKYTAEDYVKIAEESAQWIKSWEEKTPNGKVWNQSPDSTENFDEYPCLTKKALYGGSAGIGLYYIRLYQATGKKEYLQEAIEAASEIIATDEGPGFYEKNLNQKSNEEGSLVHVKKMPGWIIGLSNGPTGHAFFILKLYEITKDEKYLDYVKKVADDLLYVAKENADGIYWSEQNDYVGDGGFALFLVSVYNATKNEKYLEAAKKIGTFLLPKGKDHPRGGKYWNVVDLTIIDFPKDVFWVNMAHGSSGIGWIFTVLYKATKDERFLVAAKEIAKYIEAISVGDEEGVLVPYLDSLERGPSEEFYYLSQCHGPAGTSILFHELYLITKDDHYLEWVKRLSRGIIKAGAPEQFSRGYWPSQALCCGTPGILEHFVSVYRLTGETEFLTYAKRTARMIIGQSFVEDDKDIYKLKTSRRWLGSWWRTIPTDVHSYTGLYLGTAGNAWALLSLASVEQNKNFVNVVEYEYF